MKALARWTIGNCEELGFEILEESVRKFSEIYPEFDKIICHNSLSTNQLKKIKKINAIKYQQGKKDCVVPIGKQEFTGDNWGCGWKLCPSRLNLDKYELWIDNDVVIHKKIPLIDQWLNFNFAIIAEGVNRLYSVFDEEINTKEKMCAGFFGLPPQLDMKTLIIESYNKYNIPLGEFYEQGLVVKFITMMNYKIIPLNWLSNAEYEYDAKASGHHFVGANRQKSKPSWINYKIRKIPLL